MAIFDVEVFVELIKKKKDIFITDKKISG